MDLEAGRKRSGYEDIFIGYHAKDDVQSTYAGALFHNNRNYQLSSIKNNVSVLHGPHPLFPIACLWIVFYLVTIHYVDTAYYFLLILKLIRIFFISRVPLFIGLHHAAYLKGISSPKSYLACYPPTLSASA